MKWGKLYTKTDSWFQKSYEKFDEKLKFNGLRLSKKYISSAKTLYIEDLSNITFNYYENSPNLLMSFLKL